jgi:uncharacterized membrane protein YfcA
VEMEVDNIDYLFILVAYIVAGVIKGLTGIGFSTSCLPIMALRLDLKIAIPLVIVPSIVSNVVIMLQAGHFIEVVRRFWVLYASTIPGLLIGLSILVSINVDLAKIFLGLVLILYALLALTKRPITFSKSLERGLKIPVGFFTGFINGLTGSQVMPVLPYLLSLGLDKNTFIQAINISFTLSSVIMLFGMNQLGYLSPHTFLIAVGGAIPLVTIVYVGGKMRNRISQKAYQKLVLIFLLILGIILSVKSIV